MRICAMILIGLSLAVILPKSRDTAWGSANSKSRYATVEALVDQGTFSIDNTPYNKTVDRVRIDGKLYSSKPPMLAVITAGVYAGIKATTGWTLQQRKNSRALMVCNIVVVGGFQLLFLIFLFRVSSLLTDKPLSQLVALAAGSLGWFGAGYAVDLNNHGPAAAVGMVGLYYTLLIWQRRESAAHGDFVRAGLAIGLLPTLDLPSLSWSGLLFIWLIVADPKRTARFTLPMALVPVLISMWLTWLYSGSIKPVYLRKELYETPAERVDDSLGLYAFHLLLGHHGWLTMSPPLLLACIAVYRQLRHKGSHFWFATVLTIAFCVQFVFYVRGTRNYGGVCVGPRWLIPITAWTLPFVSLEVTKLFEGRRTWLRLLPIAFTFGLGFAQMINAAQNPWQKGRWHKYVGDLGKSWSTVNQPEDKKLATPGSRRGRSNHRTKLQKAARKPSTNMQLRSSAPSPNDSASAKEP